MFEGDGSTYNDVILPYLDMFLLVSPAEMALAKKSTPGLFFSIPVPP